MAIVGSAYVEIHAVTEAVRREIQEGLGRAISGEGGRVGQEFGQKFGDASDSAITDSSRGTARTITSTYATAGSDAGRSFSERFNSATSRVRQSFQNQRIRFRSELDTTGVATQAAAASNTIRETVTFEGDLDASGARADAATAARGMGQTVSFRVAVDNRSLTATINSVAQLARSLRVLALPAAILGATPYILSLAASFVQAAGAASLLPAALAGVGLAVGAVRLGFQGVGTALEALADQEKNAAAVSQATSKARVAAARAIQNAQESLADAVRRADRASVRGAQQVAAARRALADAQRSAAERIQRAREDLAAAYESANRRVQSAERSLADAQRAAADAQRAINRARVEAREAVEDLALSLRGAALSEEAAQLRLLDAQERLREARSEGVGGRDLQELDLAVRQAALALDVARERHVDLRQESRRSAQAGIEGSEGVVAAQRRAAEATRRVQRAEQEVARARREGLESIQDAQENLTQAQRESARQVVDAQRNLQQTIAATSQANADAARAVARAQRALQQAYADTGSTGSASAAKVSAALAALSPAALALVMAIRGLKPAWDSAQLDVQQRMLDGIASRFTTLGQTYIPILAVALGTVADGFNEAFRASLDFFNTSSRATLMQNAFNLTALGAANATGAIQPLLEAFSDLFAVGATFMPRLGNGITAVTERFRDFIAEARKSGDLATWIENGIVALKQMWNVVKNVASILGSMFDAAQAAGEPFLSMLERGTGQLAAFLNTPAGAAALTDFFRNVRDVVGSVIDKFQILWPAIKAFGTALFDLLAAASPVTNVLLTLVAGALQPFFRVVSFLAPVLGPIAVIIGSLVIAMRAWNAVTKFASVVQLAYNIAAGTHGKITKANTKAMRANTVATVLGTGARRAVTAATWLMAGAQKALNFAMRMNPIGIVITALVLLAAGIAYAWKNSETFRRIVLAAWNAIKIATLVTFGFIRDFFVGTWNAIKNAAITTWNAIKAFFAVSFAVFRTLWNGFWNGIKFVFTVTWNAIKSVAQAIWNAIKLYFTIVFRVYKAFFTAYWTAIRTIFTTVWNAIKQIAIVVWNAIKAFFVAAFNVFRVFFMTTWNGIRNIFSGVWNGIRNVAVTTWNGIRNFFVGAFNGFKTFFVNTWNSIRDSFGRAFGGIKNIARNIWNGVKSVFEGGINAVIRGVNWPIKKINGLFGINIPMLPWVQLAQGGNTAAAAVHRGSGRVRGLAGRRADRTPAALSAEEHVWSGTEVARAGGHSGMRRLRKMARDGALQGLADGGMVTSTSIPDIAPGAFVVEPQVADVAENFLRALNDRQAEALQATGGRTARVPRFAAGGAIQAGLEFARRQHGKPYIWAGVGPRGYDCSGFMSAITNVLRGEYPHRRLGNTASMPWSGFRSGLKSAFSVGRFIGNPGHMAGTLAGRNVEAGGSPSMTKFVQNAVGADWGRFTDRFHLPEVGGVFAPGGGGGGWFDPAAWFDTVAGWLKNATEDMLKRIVPNTPSFLEPTALEVFDRGWAGLRSKAVSLLTSFFGGGDGGGPNVGPVKDQVRAVARTFGWGRGAQWRAIERLVQKESSWNPNAANPNSSARGLFQKMTSIHGPVESTAAGQARWGFGYIQRRYGNPVSALAFHNRHNWYDDGGWLPEGISIAHNLTGRPEAVIPDPIGAFKQAMLDVFRELAPKLALALEAGARDQIREFTRAIRESPYRLERLREAVAQVYERFPQPQPEPPPQPEPEPPTPTPRTGGGLGDWLRSIFSRLDLGEFVRGLLGRFGVSPGPTNLQRVAAEALVAIRSGRTFFEDFSFRGSSELASRMNDQLAEMFYRQNPNFDFGAPGARERVTNFLTETASTTDELLKLSRQLAPQAQALASNEPPRIEAGAFQVTINGNADSVTIDELRDTLESWGEEIVNQYRART